MHQWTRTGHSMAADPPPTFIRRASSLALVLGLLAMVLAVAGPDSLRTAAAASGSLRINPASQSVPPNSTFSVDLVQTADVATIGAETSIAFDANALQITGVQLGPNYAAATLLVGVTETGGVPPTLDQAVAEANQTGALKNFTVFLVPGSGSVAAGDNVVATFNFQASASGTSALKVAGIVNQSGDVTPAEMIDENGDTLDVTAADGQITIDANAAPPPTPAPVLTPRLGNPLPGTDVTESSGTPVSTVEAASQAKLITSATMSVFPSSLNVAKEATFSFEVKAEVDAPATAAQAKLGFNQKLVKIVKVDPGDGWKASSSALDSAISDANKNGELNLTLAADTTNPPKAGSATIATVTMQGLPGQQGKFALTLASVDITGANGTSAPVTSKDGSVVLGSGGGSGMIWIIVGAVVLLAMAGGGAYFARRRMAAR